MQVRAKKVRIVEKDTHQFDNGDMSYRVTCGNGEGALVRLYVNDEQTYNALVPYEEIYDFVIELRMAGFKTYAEIINVAVNKG